MKTVKIKPGRLGGKVKVPSSKSGCHRSIICASLASGKSIIDNVYFSRDIEVTTEAMKNFGVKIDRKEDRLVIDGTGQLVLKSKNIHCGESGSTLRFLIPLAASMNEEVILTGEGKLVERPLDVYYNIFKEQNIYYKNNSGRLPLAIKGKLKSGNYQVRGDISSQFITGLMYELPLLDGDSEINITTNLESKPYVDITLDVLKHFGINVENAQYKKFVISGNQKYRNSNYTVEGDFSQVAFLLAIGILGDEVCCSDIKIESSQGDRVIVDIFKNMGANIEVGGNNIIARSSKTNGVIFDAAQCPDLVPAVAALASVSSGTTQIINAERLRIKESDRLTAISSQLNKIGADVKEKKDGLIINGMEKLKGGIVSSFNDHRIAMALAAVSSKCSDDLIIENAECVKKSYPDFWKDFKSLGGNIIIE
ncbi:3-phosphoshikimate 1-carboxyvinyltransferase [Clostridium tyrobutyricum]|uniref:3-phosphoshikimate 1-carboxyvinyltransferase n=1 Tax=Clostridium tyrobutyricum TaxID=1519 RepID=UPI001C391E96|nr:3-phosphoshikimate 1-carboxyvinyltransferase [Clostridium tyrobutyricum]MBV4417906.1 3-phosphoshikimate 1-carboxyvinyltransferase [Clostridium tyrobutyricum]